MVGQWAGGGKVGWWWYGGGMVVGWGWWWDCCGLVVAMLLCMDEFRVGEIQFQFSGIIAANHGIDELRLLASRCSVFQPLDASLVLLDMHIK